MATLSTAPRFTEITLASATAGPFDLSFRLFDNDSVIVYLNGALVENWTVNSTYVDGYDDNASILFDEALEIGDVVRIESSLIPQRQVDYANGPGLTEKLNIEFARLWSAISDIYRDVKRTIRTFEDASPIPNPVSKLIGFDSVGQPTLYDFSPFSTDADGVIEYATISALAATDETSRGLGAIWKAGGLRFKEVASDAAQPYRELAASGVRLVPDGFSVQPEHFGGTDAASVKKAADFVAARGFGEVFLPAATYDSPYTGTYFDDPVIMDHDNVTFRGGGAPNPNSEKTALEGGTRIRGSFFFTGNGTCFKDIGIDAGEEFVGGSGGTPIEGLIGIDRGNAGTAGYSSGNPDPYKTGAKIDNVIVMCKGTGKAGDTSDVHAFLLENYDGFSVNQLRTFKGGAGQVIKSPNGSISNVFGSGHFKYTLLFKSELYSSASNQAITNVIAMNLMPNPTVGTATDFDTGGIWFMAANATLENVIVTNFIGLGLNQAIDFFAAPGDIMRNCHVFGASLSDTQNYVVLARADRSGSYNPADDTTFGQVIDCSAMGINSFNSRLGINVLNSEVVRFNCSYTLNAVNSNAFTNSGTDTVIRGATSVDPTFAHISPDGGNLIVTGEFHTQGGSALVASGKPGDVVFDPMERHISASGHVGAIMGPTAGTMDVDEFSELAMRVRNTLGGAVAGDGIGAAIRAVQTQTAQNSAAMQLAVKTTSAMLVALELTERGDNVFFVHATKPTLNRNQTMAFWRVSDTEIGVTVQGADGTQRDLTSLT